MKTLKLIFLSLLITIAIAAIFPLCALQFNAYGASLKETIYGSLAIYMVTTTVLMTVLVTLLLIGFVRCLFPRRRTKPEETPQRFDPMLAILVFALVAVFQTDTLVNVAGGFSSAFQDLITGMTRLMDINSISGLVNDTTREFQDGQQNISALASAYLHASGKLLDLYGRFLSGLFLIGFNSRIISFYCWWLLLFLIGTLGAITSTQNSNPFPAAGLWLKSRTPAQRQRLLLAGVFLVGLYFSIAAIIAIPALQKNTLDTPITRDYVEKALQSVSTSKDSLLSRFPDVYRKDSPQLTQFTEAVAALPAAINTRADEQPGPLDAAKRKDFIEFYKPRLKLIEDTAKNATRMREQLFTNWKQLRNEVLNRNETLMKTASNAFEVASLNPLSAPERVAYLQGVVTWFQYQQSYGESMLQGSMQQLDEFDSNLTYTLPDLVNILFATSPSDSSTGFVGPRYDPINAMAGRQYYPSRIYSLDQVNQSMPNAPEPGAFAGAFGFISRWLLSTRSFSLALITGMIGFGLLGAAVTNYVRADIPNTQGQDVAAERVIIQGVSAAIVIFLTVHGGLAMLAGGEKEANGYVMCFACLVGAVFSEHVWLWAKGRLIGMLPNQPASTPAPVPPVTPTPVP